jgi:hypothetical protein
VDGGAATGAPVGTAMTALSGCAATLGSSLVACGALVLHPARSAAKAVAAIVVVILESV